MKNPTFNKPAYVLKAKPIGKKIRNTLPLTSNLPSLIETKTVIITGIKRAIESPNIQS